LSIKTFLSIIHMLFICILNNFDNILTKSKYAVFLTLTHVYDNDNWGTFLRHSV